MPAVMPAIAGQYPLGVNLSPGAIKCVFDSFALSGRPLPRLYSPGAHTTVALHVVVIPSVGVELDDYESAGARSGLRAEFVPSIITKNVVTI